MKTPLSVDRGVEYCLEIVSVGHIGEKRNLPGALDGLGELALMHGTGTGRTAGENLAALGKEPAKFCGILIVNISGLVHAELAYLSAATGLRIGFIKRHFLEPPLQSNKTGFGLKQSERQVAVVLQLFKRARRDLRYGSVLPCGVKAVVIVLGRIAAGTKTGL